MAALGSRLGSEWLLAVLLAAALGAAVALEPLYVVVFAAFSAAALGLWAAGVSLAASALGGVALYHLVSGQLFVIGVLPEAFPAAVDVVTAVLLVTVAIRPGPRAPRSHGLVVVFIALAGLALANPLVPSVEYAAFGLRQLILPLVVLLIAKEANLSRRDSSFVLGVLAVGWAANVGLALRQWLFDFTAAEKTWVESLDASYLVGDQIRLMGSTQSNQDFAFMAAVCVPVVTAFFLAARSRGLRTVLGALLLASMAVLFGSLIRSTLVAGVLGAIVAATAVTVVAVDRARVFAYGGAVLAVFLVLAVAAPGKVLPENKAAVLSSRVSSIFAPGRDPSFRQRQIEVWPQVLRIIASNPLGGGPGSAGPLSQARAGEAPFGRVVPDNGYLLVGVQLGVLGALLFMIMLGHWMVDLFTRARVGGVAAAGALGAVVAAAVAMIGGSYWSLVNPSVVLGLVVGLGLRDPSAPAPPDELANAPGSR